jgi:hypothetical protein
LALSLAYTSEEEGGILLVQMISIPAVSGLQAETWQTNCTNLVWKEKEELSDNLLFYLHTLLLVIYFTVQTPPQAR